MKIIRLQERTYQAATKQYRERKLARLKIPFNDFINGIIKTGLDVARLEHQGQVRIDSVNGRIVIISEGGR